MTIYRIFNKRDGSFLTSRANRTGVYLTYQSALNAYFQYRKYFKNLVIKEYELTNEKEII